MIIYNCIYTIILVIYKARHICTMFSKLDSKFDKRPLLQCIHLNDCKINNLLGTLKVNQQVQEKLAEFDVSDWASLHERGWTRPKGYHVTLRYLSRGGTPIEDFEDGKNVLVTVVGIAIDPRTIVFSVILPQEYKALCQNVHAHATLFVGPGCFAVASNDVLADVQDRKTFFFEFPEPVSMMGVTETQYATQHPRVQKQPAKQQDPKPTPKPKPKSKPAPKPKPEPQVVLGPLDAREQLAPVSE